MINVMAEQVKPSWFDDGQPVYLVGGRAVVTVLMESSRVRLVTIEPAPGCDLRPQHIAPVITALGKVWHEGSE